MRWRAFDRLSSGVVFVGAIAMIALTAITGWQVWGRYVLNDTPTWAERLALLLILVVSLPIAAVGLRENLHLGITFVVERLPVRVRYWVEILNAVALGSFGVAMAWFSWDLVSGTWNRDIPLLRVPQAVQYLPLVLCGALIALFMLERLAGLARRPDERDS